MNRLLAMTVVTGGVLLSVVNGAGAQGAGPRGGGGSRLYDPSTVETVRGEVVRVEEVHNQAWGRSHGIHLILKTETGGELPVHLGPAWYLDKQAMTFEPKDQVEVRGSRITSDGKPAIIAAQVTKDGKVLQLRDDRGIPVWRGRGRRGS